MTRWQHVTDPPLVLRDQRFPQGLTIVGSPVDGRVLFTRHVGDIARCWFGGTLTLQHVQDVAVRGNVFQGIEVRA